MKAMTNLKYHIQSNLMQNILQNY